MKPLDKSEIEDAKKRIEYVVARFRENAGPQFYEARIKFIDDVIESPAVFLPLMACVFWGGINDNPYLLYGLPIIVLLLLIACRFARGNVLVEKAWVNDFISDDDILYLCQNVRLKDQLIKRLKDNQSVTYSNICDEVDDIIKNIHSDYHTSTRHELINKINTQQ